MESGKRADLPGQGVLFPDLEEGRPAAARPGRGADPQPAAFGLPNKPTCTVGEAARHTGISVRQLRYFVEDGTLLAINSARQPVGRGNPGRGGARRRGKLDRWRIVVRRTADEAGEGCEHFATLEEFLRARTNKEAV